MKFKWQHLSLLLIPLIIFAAIFFEKKNDIIYMPIATSVISCIIFINFPKTVLMFHQRPLYFDDLVIKDFNEDDMKEIYDDTFRKRYQQIFRWIVTITSSIMIGILTEVWYMRSDFTQGDTTNSPTKFISADTAAGLVYIISLAGGYLKISVISGRLMIKVLKFFKRRDINKSRQLLQRQTDSDLADSGVLIGDDSFRRQLISKNSRSHNDLTILAIQPSLQMDQIFQRS